MVTRKIAVSGKTAICYTYFVTDFIVLFSIVYTIKTNKNNKCLRN